MTGSAGSDAGTITVAAPIMWSTGSLLTLTAAGAIAINATITAPSGQLALSSGGAISQTSAITAGTLTANATGTVHLLTSANSITSLGASSGGDFALTDSVGLTTGSVTANTGDLALTTTGGALTIGGAVTATAGNINLTTNGSLTLGASLSASGQGQIVTLTAGGAISQAGGTITADTLTGSSNGSASFGLTGNTIANLGAFTATGGGLTVVDSASTGLTVNGSIAGNGIALTSAAAIGLASASFSTNGGVLALTTGGNVTVASSGGATGANMLYAPSFVDNQLATGGLTLATTNGNITVAAPVSWSAGTALTLTAANNIAVNTAVTFGGTAGASLALNAGNALAIAAPIAVNGAGAVSLAYNTSAPTNLSFGLTGGGFTGSLTYNNANGSVATSAVPGQSLSINSTHYTLEYSLNSLANDISNNVNPSSAYALATSVDGSNGGAGYTAAVVPTFSGTFEGLGHTISALTIADAVTRHDDGLFGVVPNGTVRDIGLVGGSVSGVDRSNVGSLVGLLGTGATQATVLDAFATASVSTTGLYTQVGGLVGETDATSAPVLIAGSFATGTINGAGTGANVGGLVGFNEANGAMATITASYATGVATGGNSAVVGGLVGQNEGYQNGTAVIANSYASGAVGSPSASQAGGLVGIDYAAASAGNQTAATITNSFATGSVSGNQAGGLVGQFYASTSGSGSASASITNAYATGAVLGGSYGDAGAFAGVVYSYGGGSSASISNAYATGNVASGANSTIGGFAGLTGFYGGSNGGHYTIGNAYFDSSTGGQGGNAIGTDLVGLRGGIAGLATASLQGALPAGFSSATWSTGAGLYPYLTSLFPGGVQAVSGTVYGDLGGQTPLASGANGAVTVTVIGANTTLGTATTGANGYYYAFGAAGTIANGANLIAYTTQNGTPNVTNAGAITASTSTTNAPIQTGVNVYEPVTLFAAQTGAPTLSNSGINPNSFPAMLTGSTVPSFLSGALPTLVATNAAGFTIDQTLDLTGASAMQTIGSGAPLKVANAITVETGAALGLNAAGALTIDAPITAKGAAAVALAYDQHTTTPSATDLAFAQGAPLSFTDSHGGSLAGTTGAGGTLAIGGTSYTLLYSMADVANVNTNLGGAYALATNIDASASIANPYGSAVIGPGGSVSSNSPPGAFSGTLEGLGHTISNLTIAPASSSAAYIGLIGYSTGVVRDLGMVGGSVAGSLYVGGLVGSNAGTMANVYATESVSGSIAGGLAGLNSGTITNAYATGAVSGGYGLGGLVGENGDGNGNGTITQAYATGSVGTGSQTFVGGLVGDNNGGNITQAYATGRVLGSNVVGGLVGANGGQTLGTISNVYYDSQTTGQTTDAGGATGLTTAALQSGSASGLGSAFAGGTGGLYPYLKSFFPNGVQAVSGTAYTDVGLTPASGGGTVGLIVGGQSLGTATLGANGYFYVFAPVGAVTSGTLLAYSAATNSATLTNAAGTAVAGAGSSTLQTGVALYANTVVAPTSATSLSALGGFSGALSAARTTAEAADDPAHDAQAAINAATSVGLIASGASFAVDSPVTVPGAATFLVQTTAANAPITVAEPITVGTGGSLGLAAAGTLTIAAPVAVNGAGAVNIAYNTSSPTNLSFGLTGSGFVGNVTFNNADGSAATTAVPGQALTLNGQSYTLLYSMSDVSGIDFAGLGGNYALAGSLDASGTTYTNGLIGYYGQAFTGTFQGLGHTIANLTINQPGSSDIALFANTGGTIGNIGLTNVNITGGDTVGAIAAINSGTIANSFATGTVVSLYTNAGGLVATNSGAIISSYSAASATANNASGGTAGGLVGENGGGTILQSYATGAVTASYTAGGLAGYNTGNVIQSYATGAVTGTSNGSAYGGLIGSQSGGAVSASYATGTVTGSAFAGGLIGYMNGGTVTDAYAAGSVTVNGSCCGGGLIGYLDNGSGTIQNTYAIGSATGINGGYVVGGLIGYNVTSGLVSNSYWNSSTNPSGQVGVGQGDATGVSSATTSTLQSALPGGFSNAVWGIVAGQSYPYFLWQYPAASGQPQVVSGTAYSDRGTTTLAGGTVTELINGSGGLTSSTGNDGSYYFLLPPNTISNAGSQVLTYTAGASAGAALQQNATGSVASLNIYGTYLNEQTAAITLSGASSGLATAIGGNSAAQSFVNTLPNLQITFTGTSFSIDQAVSSTGAFAITGPSNSTISDPTAPVNVGTFILGGGNWVQNVGSPGALPAFVAGNDFEINGGAFLRVAGGAGTTGSPYQIVDVYGLQGINSSSALLSASYQLAGPIDASGTATWNGGAGFVPLGTNGFADGRIINRSDPSQGSGVLNAGNGFTGTLDGQNYTISGLTIDRPSAGLVGLIGLARRNGGTTVENLTLTGASITGESFVGGVVGELDGGTISQTSFAGNVAGTFSTTSPEYSASIGGLVGYMGNIVATSYTTTAITASSASGSVSGATEVGGLVGSQTVGAIANSSSSATVTNPAPAQGDGDFGGLVGELYPKGTISNSFATGNVSGSTYVGGLVGYAQSSTANAITNSYATGNVVAQDAVDTADIYNDLVAGGLVGYFGGTTISGSYATGSVSSTASTLGNYSGYQQEAYFGGLVGQNFGGTITTSYATGGVAGSVASLPASALLYAGGLAGINSGTISSSYATGAVSVAAPTNGSGTIIAAGGLVGDHSKTAANSLTQSYATGTVSSSTTGAYLGGLVGNLAGAVSQSFATGQVTGVGGDVGGLVGNMTAGSVTNSYATSAASVSGGGAVGGLVGKVAVNGAANVFNDTYAAGQVSGSGGAAVGGLIGNSTLAVTRITSSYYDYQATGATAQIGSGTTNGTTGAMTTVALKAALPGGFSDTIWGIMPGVTYPYLLFQPGVISGIAYTNAGTTLAAAGTIVSETLNGVAGSATTQTDANGIYSFLLGAAIPAQSQIFVSTSGATGGVTFVQNASSSASGIPIYGTYFGEVSSATAYSTISNGYTSAIAGLSTLQSQITALPNLALFPTGASFTVDQAVNTGILAIAPPSTTAMALGTGSGDVLSQSALNNITASTLIFGSPASTATITVGGAVTTPSSITNLELVTTGTISIGSGASLTNANANGSITLLTNANPTLTGMLTANSTSGTITIDPIAASTTIGLGSAAGTIGLTQAKLNDISADNLVIGGASQSGAITVTNTTGNAVTLPAGVTNLTLETAGTISLSSGATSLVDGQPNGDITFLTNATPTLTGTVKENGSNGIVTIAPIIGSTSIRLGSSGAGTIALTQTALNQISAATLVIGNANTTGAILLGGAAAITSPTSSLVLNTTGGVTQTAAIAATNLDLLGTGGAFTLANASNNITTLAGNAGTVVLADLATNLSIGSVFGTSGLNAASLTLSDSGSGGISQTQAISVSGTSSFTTSASNAAITLGSANLLTGAVSLNTGTSGNASLTNNQGTLLGASTVRGNLSVTDNTDGQHQPERRDGADRRRHVGLHRLRQQRHDNARQQ